MAQSVRPTFDVYAHSVDCRKNSLPSVGSAILLVGMIRGGFLDPGIRADLIAQVRDGKAETRLTRRANALLLLDDGMSCEEIAKVLYLDDDTIRYWYQLYSEKGLIWLADFGYRGRHCELTAAHQDALKSWVAQTLPRTTTMVGEWIEKSYGVSYSRSALIKLLRRNHMDYRRPALVPRKLDPAKQQAFIDGYENLLNSLGDRLAVGRPRTQRSRLKGPVGGSA
jgi:transposase